MFPKNRDTPKWMVYNGKPYFLMDDLGGKPTIFGNIHFLLDSNPKPSSGIQGHSPSPSRIAGLTAVCAVSMASFVAVQAGRGWLILSAPGDRLINLIARGFIYPNDKDSLLKVG